MSFRIVDIDPHKSPQDILNKYFDFFDKLDLEQSPKDPLTPKDIQLKRIMVKQPGEIKIRKAVLHEGSDEIIARLFVMYYTEECYEYEKNKDFVYLDLNVLKEFEESDFLKKLVLVALEIIKQFKRITVLESCSTFERVWDFWKNIGAKVCLEEGRTRLYLEEVNWDLMKEWTKAGRMVAQEEGTEILVFQECPEEIADDFAALNTEIFKLVPMEDSPWIPSDTTSKELREAEERAKEQGYSWWNIVTKEKDSKLSGLTAINFSPDEPHWVGQTITGVLPQYQGRGLGKLLKAEMMFYIKENLPKAIYIQTDNADHNAPMLSINTRMGFKQHLSEKCYKIKVEDLERNLK